MKDIKIYICKDIDDESVFVGNKTALIEYAEYLNDDAEEEDKTEIKTFADAVEVIKEKRIIVTEIDTKDLNNMQWNIFEKTI